MTITPLDQATLLLRSRAGLKEEPASRARLERLLQESANLAGIPVCSYLEMVDTQPAAFDDLLDRVTVQHSGFFRDPRQFVALAELARQASDKPHTVWSSGCGNGQEPYSLAMLLDETGHSNWQVDATDVSFRALARTDIARYTEEEVHGLSPERRRRYLTPMPGGYEIVQFIRRKVHTTHHNLARAEPNSLEAEPAVVFCRNVLMYFGHDESEACIQRIAYSMAPGGHLFLGHSESPDCLTRYFEPARVADALCYRRLDLAVQPSGAVRKRPGDLLPSPNLPDLLAEGDQTASSDYLRAPAPTTN